MSRGAFTLVEVLVAVMLVSILATGILKVSNQQKKVITYAQKSSIVSERVSLFVDMLKPQKEKKKIELSLYLKNLKINSNIKKRLNDTFFYNSFLNKTIQKSTHKTERENLNIGFKIYKQTFKAKDGYPISYYRVVRE